MQDFHAKLLPMPKVASAAVLSEVDRNQMEERVGYFGAVSGKEPGMSRDCSKCKHTFLYQEEVRERYRSGSVSNGA